MVEDPGARDERRGSLRVACGGLKIDLRLPRESISAELMNISLRGMFVRPALRSLRDGVLMTTALRPGAAVDFRLELAGESAACEARGAIAWRSDFGIGIEFTELSDALRTFVGQLIEQRDQVPAMLQRVSSCSVMPAQSGEQEG